MTKGGKKNGDTNESILAMRFEIRDLERHLRIAEKNEAELNRRLSEEIERVRTLTRMIVSFETENEELRKGKK